jgi:hypothetical protein
MPSLFYFPKNILLEARVSWELEGQLVGGGQATGRPAAVARVDGGGYWTAMLEEVQVLNENQRRTWRSVSAICDGGVQPIIVIMRDIQDQPWPVVSGSPVMSWPPVPHSDTSLFSDGSGYENGVINAHASGAAALRATSMTIEILAGSDLQGGEHFAIDHPGMRWRAYRIRTVIDNGDGTWDVTFRPPLRADVSDGQEIDFDHPRCVMRINDVRAMNAVFETIWIARPNVGFIEAFPPFPE